MEGVKKYIDYRIESFDDYYTCRLTECNLFDMYNWIQYFDSIYNDTIEGNHYNFEFKEMNMILN